MKLDRARYLNDPTLDPLDDLDAALGFLIEHFWSQHVVSCECAICQFLDVVTVSEVPA